MTEMIDILKSNKEIWEMFTRKEEYNCRKKDKHSRFSYHFSKYKNVFEPIVSKYIIENGFDFSWPNGKKFAVCLTHDVDNIMKSWKYRLISTARMIKSLRFRDSIKRLLKKEKTEDFIDIMEVEEKYDAKSTFFIIASNKDIYYKRYDLVDIKEELNYAIKKGWEIGLHGGYYSYLDREAIKNEKEKLEEIIGKKIIGYRNHFLRFKVPDTWKILSEAGFKYDTTFGYSATVGFRNGMCHPFKPFDLNENKEINIIEIPLIIMDETLFSNMNLSIEKAWKVCKKLIDIVEKLNGVLTILWHNTSFDKIYHTGWKKIYEEILSYSYERNAWLTNCENIFRVWNKVK